MASTIRALFVGVVIGLLGIVCLILWDEARLHTIRPGLTEEEVIANVGQATTSHRAPVIPPLYLPRNSRCRDAVATTFVYRRTSSLRPSVFVHFDSSGGVKCVERAMLYRWRY